jgi:hypothetical protein
MTPNRWALFKQTPFYFNKPILKESGLKLALLRDLLLSYPLSPTGQRYRVRLAVRTQAKIT